MFEIALIRPEIPQNTGNIGRLCVNTESRLHLVGPLGFSLDDKYVRRAGLDYWPYLDLSVHDDPEAFFRACLPTDCRFFSTRGRKSLWDCPFRPGQVLVFGNESTGFPETFYTRFADESYVIPMPGVHARSLNLANAVAIVLYEALRRNMDNTCGFGLK